MGIGDRIKRFVGRNKQTQTSPHPTQMQSSQQAPAPGASASQAQQVPQQPPQPQPAVQSQQPSHGQQPIAIPPTQGKDAAGTLNIALVNTTTSSSVYATVTGLATDNNSALFLLQADGQTPYYPSNVTATGQPLGENCAIQLGAPGATTNIVIPHIAGGRIYFSIGTPLTFMLNPGPALVEPSVTNPSDPNSNLEWAFCEYTFNSDQLYANISYVDFVSSIPVALTLTTTASGTQSVLGMAPGGLDSVCSGLQAQTASDGQGWSSLVVNNGANLRALSPNLGMVGNSSLFTNYYDSYVNSVWTQYQSNPLSVDTQTGAGSVSGTTASGELNVSGEAFAKPTTSDIFTCSTGPFATGQDQVRNAIIPRIAAAFNRSTLLKTNVLPAAESTYYQETVTNHYSRIVHANNKDGRGYAFPYDDVQPTGGQDLSGEVHAGDPVLWTITIGGGAA